MNLEMFPFLIKDKIYRRKLKKYIDRIVTFSDDDMIFGIETIRTKNGIIVDEIPLKDSRENGGVLTFLSVAKFQKAHGYERILKSMADYIKSGGTRKFKYYMVGYGEEFEHYHNLIEDYHLNDYVEMSGMKNGTELDEYYRAADICLSCFGLYKNGINISSALKITPSKF